MKMQKSNQESFSLFFYTRRAQGTPGGKDAGDFTTDTRRDEDGQDL